MNEDLARYERVLDLVATEIAAIRPDDLARATPCADWDLAALVGHLLGAVEYYARLADRGEAAVEAVVVTVGPDDDLAGLWAAATRRGLDAWSAPSVLDRDCRVLLGSMPGREALAIHVADLAVHAWDLATALDRPSPLPSSLAEDALATWQRVLARRDLRGVVFADEVPVPPDATATDRLVAYCGRRG